MARMKTDLIMLIPRPMKLTGNGIISGQMARSTRPALLILIPAAENESIELLHCLPKASTLPVE